MRDFLINRARSFIFSTALPPACLGAAVAALEIIAESPQMGEDVLRRADAFRHLLNDAGFNTGKWPSRSRASCRR